MKRTHLNLSNRIPNTRSVKRFKPAVQWFAVNPENLLHRPMFPSLPDVQVDFALKENVRQRNWTDSISLLEERRGVSNKRRRWVVTQACRYADEHPNNIRVRYHHSDMNLLIPILFFCAEDQLDFLLTVAVKHNFWNVVGKVLQRGVGDKQHRWAIKEAGTRAECYDIKHIVHHCPSECLDWLVTQVVKRKLWDAFLFESFLQLEYMSKKQRRWILDLLCEYIDTLDLVYKDDIRSAGFVIVFYCSDDQLESALEYFVQRGMWMCVEKLLYRCVNFELHKKAVQDASEHAEEVIFRRHILHHCCADQADAVLDQLVKRGLWSAVRDMFNRGSCSDVKYVWALHELSRRRDHFTFSLKNMIEGCPRNRICSILVQGLREQSPLIVENFIADLDWEKDLSDVLIRSAKNSYRSSSLANISKGTYFEENCLNDFSETICFVNKETEFENDRITDDLIDLLNKWIQKFEHGESIQSKSGSVFADFISCYCDKRKGRSSDKLLFTMLATVPLFFEPQNEALRILLGEKRWGIISHACLSGVWETNRRELFQEAVKQRQWSIVKKWADYTLYDDQRHWAQEEAYKEKQWDVFLQLAEYGVTESELVLVHHRLAKDADWDTVLQMFEHGADIRKVKEQLIFIQPKKTEKQTAVVRNKRRHKELNYLERVMKSHAEHFQTALRQRNWRAVLYKLQREIPTANEDILPSVDQALMAAMDVEAWHVVIQLVKIGMDANRRNPLFSEMIKRRQWGVCRVLLEQYEDVNVKLCKDALQQLMNMRQWVLVSRVMENVSDDSTKRDVMERALEEREGSLVWHCISFIKDPLSADEREDIFNKALEHKVWQAIKPLVTEKDRTGIKHRDKSLMLAIKHQKWDLVDQCQHHGANIDQGNPYFHKLAMKHDWQAVGELVKRGGSLSLPDKGCLLLQQTIEAGQWNTVKLLIEYHGDVNKPSSDGKTPLQMLIDRARAEMFDLIMLWGCDIGQGVTKDGETTLHAACEAGWWSNMHCLVARGMDPLVVTKDGETTLPTTCGVGCQSTMYYLMARGVNPLAVTKDGESVLMYAVKNSPCPQRMVAECIRLGFSTHQSLITDSWYDQKEKESKKTCNNGTERMSNGIILKVKSEVFSPFEYAFVHNLYVIRDMLYESGSCSYKELFRLYTYYSKFKPVFDDLTTDLPYLNKVATTPRSLMSTCRLVISHCFNVRGRRYKEIDLIPLREDKNYVMFSDLTDPNFGKDVYH